MEAEHNKNTENLEVFNENSSIKRERNFPALDLKDQSTLTTDNHPVLVVQSPKTPTLSRKLKAVSLDSEPQPQPTTLEVSRDVFSMPNTPKRQIKQKLSCDFDDGAPKSTLAPSFSSNLKKFASNNSISGSQTLKTLPEINALQDFSDCPIPEPQKVRTRGLLERRGSNASLTIDLGSSQNITDAKPVPLSRLNTAKSVSNLYLSSTSSVDKCVCFKKCETKVSSNVDRRNSKPEACSNCVIYESSVSKMSSCKSRCQNLKRGNCCSKSRRKSLSNENLYVPPCSSCEVENKESSDFRSFKGNHRKAVFPRQTDLEESSDLFCDDFKMQIQNLQYLQTAGNLLSVDELRKSCEASRVPKLHQEFWEVPLNLQEKCCVSGSQSKNRYKGVLPNEYSRVHLPTGEGYIHANYIKGPDYTETAYIATQGPLSHTCTDFWEMVWHSQCKCIVMLTGLVENGRNKCELYFPLGKPAGATEKTFLRVETRKMRDKFTFECKNTAQYDVETYEFEEKNEVSFDKYHIEYVGQRQLDECQIRELVVRRTDQTELRTIYHYWLSNWPDHKMANPEQVLKMAIDVLETASGRRDAAGQPTKFSFDVPPPVESSAIRTSETSAVESRKESLSNRCSLDSKLLKRGGMVSIKSKTASLERKRAADRLPIVVHCSAGIGRTGCFLAVLNGIRQLRANKNVDVLAILCSLRLNRGGMVQTAEQYELIHRVLTLYSETM